MYVVHKNLSPEINQKFITLKLFRVWVEFFQKDLRNKENLSQFTLIVGLEGNNVLHSTGDPWVFSTIFCNFLNFCLLCAKKEIDVKSRITYAQVQKKLGISWHLAWVWLGVLILQAGLDPKKIVKNTQGPPVEVKITYIDLSEINWNWNIW